MNAITTPNAPQKNASHPFPALKNDTFLRSLRRQHVDYTPIWLMRQAGRYLPEYKATRARAGSFMGLATQPHLACEVTLQPLDRYPQLDAAILFSDILTVPDAMGLGLSFAEGEGPRFAKTVRTEADVAALANNHRFDMDKLRYVTDAVTLIRHELNGRVPLIGFSGSPWTLACYMVEGGGSADFRTIKSMLYSRPDLLHTILETNAAAVITYLNAQIEAGAQAVMVFDTWGGALADGQYQAFSLAYMSRLIAGLHTHWAGVDIPSIVFTKGGGVWLREIAAIGCAGVGLDWTMNLGAARNIVNDQVALQGNIDPLCLQGNDAEIRREVAKVLGQFGDIAANAGAQSAPAGHVFNLGHGINQFTDPARVTTLLDAVREMSPQYHV